MVDRAEAVMSVLVACEQLGDAELGPDDEAVLRTAKEAAASAVAPLICDGVVKLVTGALGCRPDSGTVAAISDAVNRDPNIESALAVLDSHTAAAVSGYVRGWHASGRGGAGPRPDQITVTLHEVLELADIPAEMVTHAAAVRRVQQRLR